MAGGLGSYELVINHLDTSCSFSLANVTFAVQALGMLYI